jgi:hypothetical protein
MRRPRLQLHLSWLMNAVAIIAGLLAWLDLTSVVALVGLAAVFAVPVTITQPERRIRVAAWALSLYPLTVPVRHYATWLTAWCVLGHCPRYCLDDPKYINPLVDVPLTITAFSLSVWPISMDSGLVLAMGSNRHWSVTNPLLVLSAVWISVIAFLVWDPVSVFEWYID